MQGWIAEVGAETASIAPGSPWENGYIGSLDGRLRDVLLTVELFYSLSEAQVPIEAWRRHDNTIQPHSALGYSSWANSTRSAHVLRPAYADWGHRLRGERVRVMCRAPAP